MKESMYLLGFTLYCCNLSQRRSYFLLLELSNGPNVFPISLYCEDYLISQLKQPFVVNTWNFIKNKLTA